MKFNLDRFYDLYQSVPQNILMQAINEDLECASVDPEFDDDHLVINHANLHQFVSQETYL